MGYSLDILDLIFQEGNFQVNQRKMALCFIWKFAKLLLISENRVANGNAVRGVGVAEGTLQPRSLFTGL